MQGRAKDVVWRSWLRCWAVGECDEEPGPWALWISARPSPPAGHHHEPKCAHGAWSTSEWRYGLNNTINNLRWESYLFMWGLPHPFFLLDLPYKPVCWRVCHYLSEGLSQWFQPGLQLCWGSQLLHCRLGKRRLTLTLGLGYKTIIIAI